MNQITLDLTGCKSPLELHLIIKNTFGFPDFYGNNLSALWDSLWEYCPPDTVIYVKGVNTLPKDFDEYMNKIFDIVIQFSMDKFRIVITILMEPSGIEPLTSCVQSRRSPS